MRLRISIVAVAAGLCARLRGPVLTGGSTSAEVASRLPGDELLEDRDDVTARAIGIDAPAAAVWPWLTRMGPALGGGAYTYDWIENLLGLDMHSVDRVLPEFRYPELGDSIFSAANCMRLERVEPEHALVWRSEDGSWVWTFVLQPDQGGRRPISRNRFRLPTLAARACMEPNKAGSLILERKMLRGIKQRTEQLASARPEQTAGRSALRQEVESSSDLKTGPVRSEVHPASHLCRGPAPGRCARLTGGPDADRVETERVRS